ncbi:protein kinase domain containing protein [Acanthamoeba castellanii str. Neff]|uniref:Protein kinase domain containing protein n=1 Tax=Acanthamoeba castellanii (strain ATCC 30010 / Neff) TaxID=1257118 RepID=L8HIA0_ACACF|nr:protein kinase domain containing protein [Acanthamoeba castellanii str. Neff]ELR24935.1 protein kinase domain containing protein [Acanthamoeba castellanii str. Neff]
MLESRPTQAPPAPVSEWSAEEVGKWVGAADGAALPQYQTVFVTNDITGDLLPSLLEGTVLKDELGISSFGHRTRLTKCIRDLLGGAGGSSSQSSSFASLGTPPSSPSPSYSSSSSSSSSLSTSSSSSVAAPSSPSAAATSPPTRSDPSSDESEGASLDQSLRIGYGELQLGKVLGKGFFGEVRQGTWRGSDVAVKVIYRREFRNSDQIQLFEKEIRVLSLLRHPHIVQFLGVCVDTERCIITELMGGGSLDELVLSQFHILEANPYLRTRIILNIARGLSKIGLNEKMTAAVGYLPFQAPEVFMGNDYTEKADVYSFGMNVWFLFSGNQPEHEVGSPLKMANLVAYKQHRPTMPERIPPFWRTLIAQCWAHTPESRPTFAQIIASIQDFKQRFGPADAEKGYLMDRLPRGRPDSSAVSGQVGDGAYIEVSDDEETSSGDSGSSGSRTYHSFGSGTDGPLSSPPPSSSAAVYVEVPPRPVAESPTASSAQAPAAEQAKPGREEKKTKKLRVRKKKITARNERLIKPRKGMTQKMIVIGNSCTSTDNKSVPYEWTVYARGIDNEDITPFVKQLRRRGWGVFDMGVLVTFHDGQVLKFRHSLSFSTDHPAERIYDICFPTTATLSDQGPQ